MGGGLMQLVAYGAQDIYLTGNPQITFFKVVYRRHTNVSMEAIKQTFNGTAAFGNKVSATISRNGDLVGRMYLETVCTARENTEWNSGNSLIQEVEVEIGGQRIDKHYGVWLSVWSDLSEPNPTGATSGTLYQTMSGNGLTDLSAGGRIFIPLQFWFNRNPGLALPLIALQYHDVRVTVKTGASATGSDMRLLVDYVYLDSEERKRFAQASHEYLIEQVQDSGAEAVTASSTKIRLNFNHPCKFIAWGGADANAVTTEAKLTLNGHDRMRQRNADYFRLVQPYQHHTGGHLQSGTDASAAGFIYCYSFALKPEEHQPSGTCNFSRIDNAILAVTGASATSYARVYAINYNVLRVMSGMGGLAYSN